MLKYGNQSAEMEVQKWEKKATYRCLENKYCVATIFTFLFTDPVE